MVYRAGGMLIFRLPYIIIESDSRRNLQMYRHQMDKELFYMNEFDRVSTGLGEE